MVESHCAKASCDKCMITPLNKSLVKYLLVKKKLRTETSSPPWEEYGVAGRWVNPPRPLRVHPSPGAHVRRRRRGTFTPLNFYLSNRLNISKISIIMWGHWETGVGCKSLVRDTPTMVGGM